MVTKGRLRLLSWLHLHQCLTTMAEGFRDWGPYLGGWAPSKWFFVTMGFLCPKLGFCTPKSTSSDSKYLEDDPSYFQWLDLMVIVVV